MALMDIAKTIGHVRVTKRNKNTGIITFDKTFKNQITNYAASQSATLWSGLQVPTPSAISVGTGVPPTGQTGPTANDVGLWNELAGSRRQVDYSTVWLQFYTQFSVTYDQTVALGNDNTYYIQSNQTITDTSDSNGANPNQAVLLTEAGLWDAKGNLWSHVVINVQHDNQSTLSIQWQILHQGN